jgi:hypothetical protein
MGGVWFQNIRWRVTVLLAERDELGEKDIKQKYNLEFSPFNS